MAFWTFSFVQVGDMAGSCWYTSQLSKYIHKQPTVYKSAYSVKKTAISLTTSIDPLVITGNTPHLL